MQPAGTAEPGPDDTGRYRVAPEVSAGNLVQRYRRQLWIIATPLFLLLLVLSLWQAFQARGAVVAELERQATQQHAALQTLARVASDHVADLRLLTERELVTPLQAPDRALRDALRVRGGTAGHGADGYALDDLPPLLHAGSAQLLWPQAGAPPPDAALAQMQSLSRTTELAHSRHADLAASSFLAWPERWLARYPWVPSQSLVDGLRAGTVAQALDIAYAHPAFSGGRPEANGNQHAYWTPVQRGGDEGPRVIHAAPVYDGEDFRGVVSTEVRLSSIARVAPAQLVGTLKEVYWWVLNDQGEVLAERMATEAGPSTAPRPLPNGLDKAALAEAQRSAGRAVAAAGHRVIALDVADAPWTLVLALGDGALMAQVLPGLLPFTLIALALLGMFLQAQSLLRRRVIEPALGVMGYLHAKSQDPYAPEPELPPRWRPWARVVTRTFDEQRAARAAERRSEAFKSAIVDHALAAMVATDAQGRIVEFNPAAVAMFGVSREAALGRPVSQVIIPPRYREAHDAGMRRIASGGPARILGKRVEMQALRADGSEFPVEMLLWRADVSGEVHFTASLVDLSERREAALEIERQREALRQSEKLSAMGSLLAGVAHELNNPLAIVLGRASLLEEKCEQLPGLSPDQQAGLRSDAQRIREAADRCGRIVRTFLNMARSRPTQRQPVAFNELVQAAAEMLAYTWRSHGIVLELDLAASLPKVMADGDQIGQVVLNLLVNAQQALSSSSGPRRVRASTGVERPRADREPRVWLRVADSGPGIAPELAEKIFEPFFTTKAEGIGTGLGLAVSRSLAREHGGNLSLEPPSPQSSLGGACFRLSLPLSGEAGPETEATALDEGASARRSRVLVVDDETEVAELIRDMLESAGHDVAVAESGAVALELLDTARFDAIVSDLRMPDMDGAALRREIQRLHPALAARLMFITGDTLSPGARDFLDATACPRLDKPFGKADLLTAVSALLA
ncbi:hybrid sensor histidine kinase/response regulator [Aquabacterium sp.]|uniref:hybrid sensor histidine kinase/response regulator n=1 Tax=Aquabacterium sp. TaxID=1872578 RepID=UPI002C5FC055|nr:PAS domain S-box protein [Aquabacterium sp.]HSW07981.1 PAS domain S-box protein [Aquabacterium sp.]